MIRKTVKNEALPKGWREVRLGEVCSIDKRTLSSKTLDNYCFDYIALSDIDRGKLLQTQKCKFSEAPSRARRIVTRGDVLLATVRPNLQGFYIFRDEVKDYIVSTGFAVLTPKPDLLDSAYLFQMLFSHQMLAIYYAVNVGSNYPAINSSDIPNFKILIPPLSEQKAIASLLETWDTAIEKTEALIAAKEMRFKWLLKRLISDYQDNPEWRKGRLEDTCEVITSPVDKKTVDGELPVKLCNYTDVYYNHSIDSKINFMTATAKPREIEKFSIIKDDVIITKDSETPDDIGVPAYVKETISNLLCGYHLTILRPKKQVTGKYICYALTSPRVKNDFYRFANGITRFGLTTESYQKIKIPVPPLSEQKKIAHMLNTTQREIDLLKRLTEKHRTQKRGLMQKLLTGKWRVK